MRKYKAKYYPIVNGKETEYVTTVMAEDRRSAESAVRESLIKQLVKINNIAKMFNAKVVGCNMADMPNNIDFAKNKMKVIIY